MPHLHHRAALPALVLSWAVVCPSARAADLSFDYTSFESGFGQAQFNVLNYPSINGRYMMTSTDNHRPEMVANGNTLAEFYNNFLADYNTQAKANAINAAAEADAIHQYTLKHSTNNGPRPEWLVLNEISSSLWSANPGAPSQSTYRTWLIDCVTRLTQHHGYKVVTLAPFQNPGQNNASWQALSAIPNNYVGIECYLSGPEVWAGGTDYASRLAWAQQQYQASKNSYIARGVPASKLFVTEHFANNNATYTDGAGNVLPTGWGRAGMASAADWDAVIQIRQDAIYNVGFDGFLAYNWGGNAMGVTQAEQIQHEYYYRSRLALRSQQPQWLSDTAINVNGTVVPLSWDEPLNWVGGVPNAPGAVANFYRTNTAARTVTLDGSRTAGTLTFNSPAGYTIAAGAGGGSIVLDNTTGNAAVSVTQGSHTISAGVRLNDGANVAISSSCTLTVSGAIAGAGGVTKNGPGTLALTHAANGYTGGTTVNAGALRVMRLHENNAVSVAGGKLQIMDSSPTLPLHPAGNNASVSRPSSLTIANDGAPPGTRVYAGQLDLGNNDLILDYSGGASPRAEIEEMVRAGYNGGNWLGNGITSSTANANQNFALAVADNAQLVIPFGDGTPGGGRLFAGQVVDSTTILVKFTHRIDLDLDGVVTSNDASIFNSNYREGDAAYWGIGDVDYDGIFTSNDATIFNSSYNEALASVPEPAALGVLALAAAGMPWRRRRPRLA